MDVPDREGAPREDEGRQARDLRRGSRGGSKEVRDIGREGGRGGGREVVDPQAGPPPGVTSDT